MTTRETYDAIVVGSGAAGGWAAKELTERGLKTILLEAGRSLDPVADFPPPPDEAHSKVQLSSRVKAALGGQHIQARCMSFSPLTRHLFINDRENPYVTPLAAPFNWYRGRQVGGRLHLWGRNALRISDYDLRPADQDGFGENWPITYAELAPWYDKVETFLGVWGSAAGIATLPDGKYEQPLPLTEIERRVLHDLAEKWPGRPATTARIVRHNPQRVPLTILAAMQTGNLTLRSDAVVSRINLDPASGKARGVVYVDRKLKAEVEVQGRVVVLCASTIESLRMLLNSKSSQHPAGLGNSSGRLGRYLTDHVMMFQAGPYSPLEKAVKTDAYDFGAQTGIYIPSFRNTRESKETNFLRGYSLLGSVGRIEPGWFFLAAGEMLPRHENRVELDPRKRDAWGIRVARITCVHSENEKAMVRDIHQTMVELARDCGLQTDILRQESALGRLAYKFARRMVYTPEGALVPGSAIHETGGAAMGNDPRTSVLNRFNQCWDASNVFVTDSASFPSAPFQNPGLTIMALSARAGNFIADALQRGEF